MKTNSLHACIDKDLRCTICMCVCVGGGGGYGDR